MQVYNHNESAVADLELIILRLRPSQNFHIGFLKSSGTTGTTAPSLVGHDGHDGHDGHEALS